MGMLDQFFGRRKKPRPDFSNVQSGGSSHAPAAASAQPSNTTQPGPTMGKAGGRVHVVVSGDSLSKIAEREYGDANLWPRIFEANRDLVKNPDLIYPGQKLTIPTA
jgi:nucleoid-associated protein YgaU